MNKAVVRIETEGYARPTEIPADLRTVAEALYHPMRVVGMWDVRTGGHLCPQRERGEPCPHDLPAEDPRREEYRVTLQRERRADLEVHFPHAGLVFYLS